MEFSGMEWTAMIAALISSAAFGAIVTALIAKASSDKAIEMENIVKQREQWREKLRELVDKVNGVAFARDRDGIRSVKAKMTVLLNPLDDKDMEILDALEQLSQTASTADGQDSPAEIREFNDRVAYLLKHDWERVKRETSLGISFQSLGMASLFVAFALAVTGMIFGIDVSQPMRVALVLGIFMIIAGIISSPPKRPLTPGRLYAWLKNNPYREPYRSREDRKNQDERRFLSWLKRSFRWLRAKIRFRT